MEITRRGFVGMAGAIGATALGTRSLSAPAIASTSSTADDSVASKSPVAAYDADVCVIGGNRALRCHAVIGGRRCGGNRWRAQRACSQRRCADRPCHPNESPSGDLHGKALLVPGRAFKLRMPLKVRHEQRGMPLVRRLDMLIVERNQSNAIHLSQVIQFDLAGFTRNG